MKVEDQAIKLFNIKKNVISEFQILNLYKNIIFITRLKTNSHWKKKVFIITKEKKKMLRSHVGTRNISQNICRSCLSKKIQWKTEREIVYVVPKTETSLKIWADEESDLLCATLISGAANFGILCSPI